ncbi:MAG: glycosyltransferase family 39 protein [Anaerolineae bacterium]|nr:glycosyltransferase family 39 protein [Anaerolineae bacterium]
MPSQPARYDTKLLMLWMGLLFLLLFWLTRLIAIDIFPLFIDETIHIHLGEDGYRLSPFVNAELGRVFTGWWHMLFQTYASGTPWIARTATLLLSLVSLSTVVGLGRRIAGVWAGVFGGLFYLLSSYHMFYERLALADSMANTAVLLAIYFAYRLRSRVNSRDALLTGLFLFIAFGAKTSVLPYYGIPIAAGLALHPTERPWRQQMMWTGVALGTALGLTVLFVLILTLLGYDFLSNWVSYAATSRQEVSDSLVASVFSLERIGRNIVYVTRALIGYIGAGVILFGVEVLVTLAVRRRWYLLLCIIGPSLAMWFSVPQEIRYWGVSLVLLMLCSAIVLAEITHRQPAFQVVIVGLLLIWGAFQWLPFSLKAWQHPIDLPLPATDRDQYINSDASGFGLPEARDYLAQYPVTEVIGILSNCQSLRYMSQEYFEVICPNINPNGSEKAALTNLMNENRRNGVYVILEDSPYIPASAPGTLMTAIERPAGKANLTIYDISE